MRSRTCKRRVDLDSTSTRASGLRMLESPSVHRRKTWGRHEPRPARGTRCASTVDGRDSARQKATRLGCERLLPGVNVADSFLMVSPGVSGDPAPAIQPSIRQPRAYVAELEGILAEKVGSIADTLPLGHAAQQRHLVETSHQYLTVP